MRILIAGATGYLGRCLIRELMTRSHHVAALIHRGSDLKNSARLGAGLVELRLVEPRRPSTFNGMCAETDMVISLAGLNSHGSFSNPFNSGYALNELLLAEAIKSHISRFVFVSLSETELRQDYPWRRSNISFEQILKMSSIPHTIMRPTAARGTSLTRWLGRKESRDSQALETAKWIALHLDSWNTGHQVHASGSAQINEVLVQFSPTGG